MAGLTESRGEHPRIGWLREAVARGDIHTVRYSFADRLGGWRGKRLPAAQFLGMRGPMGFCDGMIVCDVQCDVSETTPFTNYDTGYPDMHVWPTLDRLRPVGWVPGEAYVFGIPCDARHQPLNVAPVAVLQRVLGHLADSAPMLAFTLAGRLMAAPDRPLDVAADLAGQPGVLAAAADGLRRSGLPVRGVTGGAGPGAFRLLFQPADPVEAAEAVVVAKGALKELARQRGAHAVFMTLSPGAHGPSTLEAEVSDARDIDPAVLQALLDDARALLQPSVNALKLGPQPRPAVEPAEPGDGTAYGTGAVIRGISASSEADPFTVAATVMAGISAPAGGAGPPDEGVDLGQVAGRLTSASWLADWLGKEFLDNQAALLVREAQLFRRSVTDWEITRYWNAA